MNEIRQRVVCYITREQRELLVFEHPPEYTSAGIQVPGGGIEPDENHASAAIRETLEESGLKLENPVCLGSRVVHLPESKYEHQEFHFYWLEANEETRNSWTHFAENKYLFTHRFVPLEDVGTRIPLSGQMDALLPELRQKFQTRQRVVVYITRNRAELLVFEHNDPGLESGTQVVAGGIEPGETPEEAALREVWEEAGLRLAQPTMLGSVPRPFNPQAKYPKQTWHHLWLEAAPDTPNAWDHTVSAGEEDQGMVYRHQFVALEEIKLEHGLEALLPELFERIFPQVVVCCAMRNNEILLLETPNSWRLPQANLHPNETYKGAVTRALFKQTGLKSKEVKPLGAKLQRTATGLEYQHFFRADVNDTSSEAIQLEYRFVPLEDVRLDWELDAMLKGLSFTNGGTP